MRKRKPGPWSFKLFGIRASKATVIAAVPIVLMYLVAKGRVDQDTFTLVTSLLALVTGAGAMDAMGHRAKKKQAEEDERP